MSGSYFSSLHILPKTEITSSSFSLNNPRGGTRQRIVTKPTRVQYKTPSRTSLKKKPTFVHKSGTSLKKTSVVAGLKTTATNVLSSAVLAGLQAYKADGKMPTVSDIAKDTATGLASGAAVSAAGKALTAAGLKTAASALGLPLQIALGVKGYYDAAQMLPNVNRPDDELFAAKFQTPVPVTKTKTPTVTRSGKGRPKQKPHIQTPRTKTNTPVTSTEKITTNTQPETTQTYKEPTLPQKTELKQDILATTPDIKMTEQFEYPKSAETISSAFDLFLARMLFVWASAAYSSDNQPGSRSSVSNKDEGGCLAKLRERYTLFTYENPRTLVKILMGYDDEDVVIAFRGTDNPSNMLSNTDVRSAIDPGGSDLPTGIFTDIHRGFWDAYVSVRHNLLAFTKTFKRNRIYITGHSLGGALAHIASLEIKGSTVYSFGSPKFSGWVVADKLDTETDSASSQKSVNWRIYNRSDWIPTLPFTPGYKSLKHFVEMFNGSFSEQVKTHKSAPTDIQSHSRKEYWLSLLSKPLQGSSLLYNVAAGNYEDSVFDRIKF